LMMACISCAAKADVANNISAKTRRIRIRFPSMLDQNKDAYMLCLRRLRASG
jgi:hypothetical protein